MHEVCFDQPFWIDVYEMTNAQYGGANPNCIGVSSSDDQPRICVSWFDAQAHCQARGARLPTEAEWEYAARGPDSLVFPWGNTFDGSRLNFCDSQCERDWADQTIDDGYIFTAPVASYPGGTSWVGALDLSGNVWEWVNDWYEAGYYATLAAGAVNPQGPASGEYRVFRSGAWYTSAGDIRAADRSPGDPFIEHSDIGFRCALSYQP